MGSRYLEDKKLVAHPYQDTLSIHQPYSETHSSCLFRNSLNKCTTIVVRYAHCPCVVNQQITLVLRSSPGVLKLFWLEEPLATFNKSQDISSAPPSNIKDVVVIVNIKKKTNAAFAVWPHSTVRRGATYVSQTEYE